MWTDHPQLEWVHNTRYFCTSLMLLHLFSKGDQFRSRECCFPSQKRQLPPFLPLPLFPTLLGWSGIAKVSCILCLWGVQLILAYSWARPAILVIGKGIGGCFQFFCFFTFILVISYLFLSFIFSTISFLPFSGRWHKMIHKGWHVVKPQHNQSLHPTS